MFIFFKRFRWVYNQQLDGEFLFFKNLYFFSKSIISIFNLSYSLSEIFGLFFHNIIYYVLINSLIFLFIIFYNHLYSLI